MGLQLFVPYLRTAAAFGTRRESRLQVGTSWRVPKSKPEEQVGAQETQLVPSLPALAYFSKNEEVSGLERAKSGDLWSITSPQQGDISKEKQFVCSR